MKNKLNQSDADFIYRSEVANEKLGNMSAEECQKLFGIIPTDPTIEEVKEEWEDEGYVWKETEFDIKLIFKCPYYLKIRIFKNTKKYQGIIDLQEHIRLTKTFRALGWEV